MREFVRAACSPCWALLVLVGVACSGPVIPLTVTPGSSIVIPLGGEVQEIFQSDYPFPPIGFKGSQSGLDEQRGELKFYLCETGDSDATCLATDAITPRIVTRLYPDPASPAALEGSIGHDPGVYDVPLSGQVFVVLDVPEDALPVGETSHTYSLFVASTPPSEATVSWSKRWTITVVESAAGPGIPTPLEAWNNLGETYKTTPTTGLVFERYVPYPKLVYKIFRNGEHYAHALTAVIDVPDEIEVRGVIAEGHNSADSLLRWTMNSPTPGDLTIHAVAPEGLHSFAVVFSLASGATPVQTTDFPMLSHSVYDSAGVLETDTFVTAWEIR